MHTTSSEGVPQQNWQHLMIGFLLLLWAAAITMLGLNDTFVTEPGEAPLAILISFMLSFVLFTIAYLSFPAFRDYLMKLDMRFLIMLHSWRMLGMGFVMLHLFDELPGLFAYLAGLGDALTAIAAVFIAYALFSRRQGVSRRVLWRWNTFGLLDFVVAVSVGIMTRADAMLAPDNGVNSDIMTMFPFVIVPGFLVQVFFLTHIIIYLQLRNNHSNQEMITLPRD